MLKLQNKKVMDESEADSDKDYVVDDQIGFAEDDVSLAKVFADAVALIVHSANRLKNPEEVIHAFSEVQQAVCGGAREAIYSQLLRAANILLGAGGSFIAWQSEMSAGSPASEFSPAFSIEDTYPPLRRPAQVPPVPRLAREAIDSNRLMTRTSDGSQNGADPYFLWPRTRTAYASPIHVGRNTGVLQVEFETAELVGLIQGRIVEAMCRYIENVAIVLQRQAELVATGSSSIGSAESIDADLKNLLEILVAQYRLTAGLIWVADDVHAGLRYGAHIGCDFAFTEATSSVAEPQDLFFKYSDESFATYVWNQRRPIFVNNLQGYKPVRLDLAARLRVREVVGVPLMAGEGAVGVLIAWTPTSDPDGASAAPDHVSTLAPLAKLAASAIRSHVIRRRAKMASSAMQSIIYSLSRPFRLEAIRSQILEAIRFAGFDRVRLYDYDSERAQFKPVAWRGMVDDELKIIAVADCKADRHLLNTLGEGARRYSPKQIGPDDNAGKEKDTEWAVAPIIVDGQVCGKVAVDCQYTKREISTESLQYLNVFSALLGYASFRSKWNEIGTMERIASAIRTLGQHVCGSIEVAAEPNDLHGKLPTELAAWLRNKRATFTHFANEIQIWHDLQHEKSADSDRYTSFRDAAQRVLTEIQEEAAQKRITIIEAFVEHPCDLPIPESFLRIIVHALISNAIRHANYGGFVEIESTIRAGYCEMIVKNDGDRIPPEYRMDVFKPFFVLQFNKFANGLGASQGPEARMEANGFGLGLAIAHELVQRYHGTLTCGEGVDGLGTAFVCRFPF